MQRLEYHLTVQSDCVVRATFDDSMGNVTSRSGSLNLSDLETITKDHLPILETQRERPRDRLERLGTLLYQLLFPQPIAGHFEERAWSLVEDPPDCYYLALSLTLQEGLRPDVAALPWEFLYIPVGQTFLATDRRVAFSRRPADQGTLPHQPLAAGEALKVMLVHLQPQGLGTVALAPIQSVLNEWAEKDQRLLRPLVFKDPSPQQVERELEDYKPHIFHLLAHGRFEDRGTYFALVDGTGKAVRWYRDRSLVDIFQIHRPRLVLLQACEGGRTSDISTFVQGAARLAHHRIPAVVAMQYPITNRTGWTFARELYRCLVAGDATDVAVQRARRILTRGDTQASDDHASRDFAAPTLWMWPQSHHLFGKKIRREKDSMVNLRITTPYDTSFEADAPPHTRIGQVAIDLLSQWQPPADKPRRSYRYALRLKTPTGAALEPSATLKEVDVDTPSFELVSEQLDPDSPVGLMVEDSQGQRYTTAVLLSTSINHLAKAFLASSEATPGRGMIVVELVGGLPGAETTRRLDLNSSLYEEGVHDYAILRVYHRQEPGQE